MFDTNNSMSDARRFLLAVGGALLFSLACLATALGPVNANCFCSAAKSSVVSSSPDRPALL